MTPTLLGSAWPWLRGMASLFMLDTPRPDIKVGVVAIL